jgi:very-short-patch-repair endonuclease
MAQSYAEDLFGMHLRSAGIGNFAPEYRFHPERKWRFDFAWPDIMLAVEIEGGIWAGGRHVRGQGFEDDLVKYNEAAKLGWIVLRYSTKQVTNGHALSDVIDAATKRVRQLTDQRG